MPDELLNDEEMAPFLAHFLAFVDDLAGDVRGVGDGRRQPDEKYAGTLDYLVRSPLIVEALVGRAAAGRTPTATPA
jgi:hypothetical protein